jgi:hypothetical protein
VEPDLVLPIAFGIEIDCGLGSRFPDPSDLALRSLVQAGLAADRREHEAADYGPGRRGVRLLARRLEIEYAHSALDARRPQGILVGIAQEYGAASEPPAFGVENVLGHDLSKSRGAARDENRLRLPGDRSAGFTGFCRLSHWVHL